MTATIDNTSESAEMLERWSRCSIRPVWPKADEHALHAYFNISPEHPDGRRVILFVSPRSDAQVGRICWIDRETGETAVLDDNIEVEDAHRQSNQQWVCNGDYAVYMTYENNDWLVCRVNPDTLEKDVLCTGRQVFWGSTPLDEVPLYRPHWNPGPCGDLEMLNVRTGAIRTAVTVDSVIEDHKERVAEIFGEERPESIAFPVLSPDGSRVFFKLSKVKNGGFRSNKASLREGLFVYDTKTGKSVGFYDSWGHPSWMPDSKTIFRKSFLIDTDTMQTNTIPWYPEEANSHGTPSPDGKLLTMDIARDEFTARDLHWAIVVGDFQNSWCTIHTDPVQRHGTTSWRQAHPHPVFNNRGKRIYFNANLGDWVTLHVAEIEQ
ncbi:MAG: hypothetical protein JXR97_13760 [Planctomycetes bacterium]|nr:hypothetical protein [Planctomycetota bacterium]